MPEKMHRLGITSDYILEEKVSEHKGIAIETEGEKKISKNE